MRPTAAAWRLTAGVVAGICFGLTGVVGSASADPSENYEAPTPLPIVVPTPTDWQPQFPFPFDNYRRYVTDADVNAERDMCQWFNAQYYELKGQIERLNNTIVRNNGNFAADGVTQQVDIVTANIDRALDFLAPRAQALTQSYDHAGDMYFPIYQGDSFYGLWQQLSNVGNGLTARQPTWFTGPSFARAQHWGSKINRSHVCQ
ncbi:hypothetical protein Y900_004665 [Mycolicibacterium aromaticivorans JS19b1 = JCM 16368]|uniref:Uncharacterized protein n=1 Tax=Mycolicibacterium aromaticivorans JS19b1 = JCM 16368 TaxID=1440774 RepID=A0A064CEY3_9MYCO|nr:hypothetical protein [Mycolicibacterium aromaticivorans]KDE98251.1 hypothetical protein Y900_004665 [Mycolicibacterium aromaticivorans JS19b1 = JCM 16368]